MQSPKNIIRDLIEDKLSSIPELKVKTRSGTVQVKNLAKVGILESRLETKSPQSFSSLAHDGTAIEQVETMRFEVVLDVVDIRRIGNIHDIEEAIRVRLSTSQWLMGQLGATSQALSPLWIESAGDERTIKTEGDTAITESVIIVCCKMQRCNGFAPKIISVNQD